MHLVQLADLAKEATNRLLASQLPDDVIGRRLTTNRSRASTPRRQADSHSSSLPGRSW